MDQRVGEEFSVFADEASEWAEVSLATALETWPDEDWAGPGFTQRNAESSS